MAKTRLCVGFDSYCGQFMAPLEVDDHEFCARCQGPSFCRDLPCAFCISWTEARWDSFKTRRTYKQRKNRSADRASTLLETFIGARPPVPAAQIQNSTGMGVFFPRDRWAMSTEQLIGGFPSVKHHRVAAGTTEICVSSRLLSRLPLSRGPGRLSHRCSACR